MDLTLRILGRVRSPLSTRADAPRQGDEGAPPADLEFDEAMLAALAGIRVGAELLILTWLHEADRTALAVHPRGDASRPETGVFATRSPDRPNPIGLHRVTVLAAEGTRLRVSGTEAIDGTPVLDVKPMLGGASER